MSRKAYHQQKHRSSLPEPAKHEGTVENDDSLPLPPRSEVHNRNHKRKKKRTSFLLIRTFVLLFILFIAFIPFYLSNEHDHATATDTENERHIEEVFIISHNNEIGEDENQDYIDYEVKEGDTLTSIVQQYYPNDNANVWVERLKAVNNIEHDHITVGETLRIPFPTK
ncbi:LysM peptidoglycan-binding domain-containing protein [Salirhabdus salicampi]|uniref:LysM peptidoglycan-binding domain-containing protein n=1 Tax=Salirhabdus salicampi TaxID=476102 RepID=UPI0020C3D9EC|nr:LysM peptidoglycan-binding domain-containing protein [Salirhabdus salicampi]MCP8616728.1 LysM peptidoglycan-binding domain-containing protein [Salirhabdus salicampi]